MAWWKGLPEWRMLEDLPKFGHLMVTPEPQTAKGKKLKQFTRPWAAMKCLATGLWLALTGIVLIDVLTVRPVLNAQVIPVQIEFFFRVMLMIPPLLAAYLMFCLFCSEYFPVLSVLWLSVLWVVVNLFLKYLDTQTGCLMLAIPFFLALFYGWKQGIIGWRESYHMAPPANGRVQAISGLVLMLLLTSGFVWVLIPFLPNGPAQWKFILKAVLIITLATVGFAVITRRLNKILSFD